jgi:hypothetical protein
MLMTTIAGSKAWVDQSTNRGSVVVWAEMGVFPRPVGDITRIFAP